MSANRKLSDPTYTDLGSLNDNTRFPLTFNGGNYNVLWSVLKTLILALIVAPVKQVCLASTTTYISLGASATYSGFTIDYNASIGTTRSRAGIIKVTKIGTTAKASDIGGLVTIPDDGSEFLNMTFDADIDSGQIRLHVINGDASNISFQYTKISFLI